jgi:addiction module RelB/DinJ family antitoxin
MAATALVQAKLEPKLKKEAEACLDSFGLDTSTAIRLFLVKVVQTGRIPFVVGNEDTDEDEDDIRLANEACREYFASGCKSRPLAALKKELGL